MANDGYRTLEQDTKPIYPRSQNKDDSEESMAWLLRPNNIDNEAEMMTKQHIIMTYPRMMNNDDKYAQITTFPLMQNNDDIKEDMKTFQMRQKNDDNTDERMQNKVKGQEEKTMFPFRQNNDDIKRVMTTFAERRKKRNPGCMRQCLLLRLLHPSQCHFIC